MLKNLLIWITSSLMSLRWKKGLAAKQKSPGNLPQRLSFAVSVTEVTVVSCVSLRHHVFSKAKISLVHVNVTCDHSGSNEEAANAWIRRIWSGIDGLASYLLRYTSSQRLAHNCSAWPFISTGGKHITRCSHHPCTIPASRCPHVLLTKHVLSFKQVSFKAFRRDTASCAKAN